MKIQEFIHSNKGRMFVSILLGIGLSSLFRKVCNDRNCLVFKGPSYDKINEQVFEFQSKCYKYTADSKKCDAKKKIVEFA